MIMTMLSALIATMWARFSKWIVIGGAAGLAVLVAFMKGMSKGKAVYREKHEKASRKAVERTQAIKHKVDAASDDDVIKQMEKYYRD